MVSSSQKKGQNGQHNSGNQYCSDSGHCADSGCCSDNKNSIKCAKCEGFGHIVFQCANNRNKAHYRSINTENDHDRDEFENKEHVNNFGSLTMRVDEAQEEEDNKDGTYGMEELQDAYEELYSSWEKMVSKNKVIEDKISRLQEEKKTLNIDVAT